MNLIGRIYRRLANWDKDIRGYVLSLRLRSCGRNLRVWPHLLLRKPDRITIGDHVGIDRDVDINIVGSGELVIGNHVWIGRNNVFYCGNRITIHDYALFGPHVHVYDSNHAYEDVTTPIVLQGRTSRGPVTIGEGCWIGAGVKILSGVTIGRNSVVGANSVVTRDIPPYCVGGEIRVACCAVMISRRNVG